MARKQLDAPALVVVDAQFDYLDGVSDKKSVSRFIERAAEVLGVFRQARLPVLHVRTLVQADGAGAMQHRVAQPLCVEGTRGAAVPDALQELEWEPVYTKSHFSGFDNSDFEAFLRSHPVKTLVIVGAHTHACVRETAVDAYRRGFDVIVLSDAVVSNDKAHAASTLEWLNGRVAEVIEFAAIEKFVRRSGREWDDIGDLIDAARNGIDATLSLAERAAILHRFADRIESKAKRFAKDISRAVNKPLPLAQDEVFRAVSHIRTAAKLPSNGFKATVKIAPGVTVRNEPVGVVALLMPWNNPLAIPAGKIAAAFLGGNGIVLKPSPLDGGIGTLLVAEARAAGLAGLEIVEPADAVGAQLAWHPNIDAIAITGSVTAGQEVAQACAATGKTLQAELGGNNAAIVATDADLSSVVPELVRNAFVYSGQRCTAIRRWVVDESIYDEFVARALDETAKFASDPLVGELINDAAAARVVSAVDSAVAAGATRLTPASTSRKRRVAPVIVRADSPHSDIVQRELFGPVAVIQVSTSLDEAIELANGVTQGLLIGVCSSNKATIERVTRESSVGVVQIGGRPVPVHPDAPFGGWGHSGIGPAEHGVWDMQFYTRPRTVYNLSS
jgi:aldehyde dehydrogenase (NAD+)